MRRVMATALIAAAVVGCSESKTSLTDRLAGPSFLVGEPPPPPIPGSGTGLFSSGSDFLSANAATKNAPPASSCPSVSQTLVFTTRFFQNNPGTETWLKIDETSPATAHFSFHDVETKGHSKLDGSGELVGLDGNGNPFTFQISTVSGETLIPGPSDNPYHPNIVHLDLTGTLTIGGQTCKNVSASFDFTYASTPTNTPS